MTKLNYKNALIKKLQYRSIYSGSKELDFVLSSFAKNNLELKHCPTNSIITKKNINY